MSSKYNNLLAPGLKGAFFYGSYWLAAATFDPYLNVYYYRLGLSGVEIGWLSILYPVFILITPPWVSRLADKYSIRVKFLVFFTLAFAASITLNTFPKTFLQFLPVVALFSFLRSCISPMADSLIANMASKYQMQFGNMRLWGSITYFITCLGLGAVWNQVGFGAMFITGGLLLIPTAFAAALLEEPTPQNHQEIVQPSNEGFSSFFKDRGIVLLTLATILNVAAMSMSGTFSSIFMQSIGGNETWIGAFWGIAALGEIPSMTLADRISKKIGNTNTLMGAYLLSAVSFIGTALSPVPWILIVFSCFRGLGFGLMIVTTITIIDQYAPTSLKTTYQGLVTSLSWGLAALITSPLSGYLYQNLGANFLFTTCFAFSLLACSLLMPTYWLWRKQTIPQP